MPPVLASTAVLENTPGNLGQAKGIVKLPIGEKSSVGSDLGTVELKLQSTGVTGIARCDDGIALILIIKSPKQVIKLVIYLGNPG